MADLSGRRALVTGAGMGIGQAIAVELARGGAAVALHYAHTEPAETLARVRDGGRARGGGDPGRPRATSRPAAAWWTRRRALLAASTCS